MQVVVSRIFLKPKIVQFYQNFIDFCCFDINILPICLFHECLIKYECGIWWAFRKWMTNKKNHAVPIRFYIYLNLTFEAYLPNIRDEKRMHDNRWAYAFCYMVVPSTIVIYNVRVFEYMCICLCISISNFTHMSNKVSKFTYYNERRKRYSLIQTKVCNPRISVYNFICTKYKMQS